MKTVSAAEEVYWGTGGEYGPFPIQTEGEWAGWPDFGKVMHYFLKKSKMGIEEFAALYGRKTKTDHTPITRRQVERMIYENEVPDAMSRRKIIANLLNIPPMLFGLAVLENVTLKPHPEVVGANLATGQTTLTKVIVDTTKYQSNIHTLWVLHDTSQAQNELDQINADIRDLESLESQARGDLLSHIRELLFSYRILAANVVRDQRNFSSSHHHANQAVRVAKAERDSDLIATSLYTRGCTYLEWGTFGTLARGVFQIQEDKIIKAIRNFEEAKQTPENGEEGLHPQLLGLIRMHLSRAYAILKLRNGEKIPAFAITMLDDAADNVDCQKIDDTYTRVLITGTRTGFIKGRYLYGRASAFSTIGMTKAALKELNGMETVQKGNLGKDLTRYHAGIDIIRANTFMGLEQFEEATRRAKKALFASRDINSITSLANLIDIHGRLLKSSYKNEPEVSELGDMIRETVTKRIQQNEAQIEEQVERERDY